MPAAQRHSGTELSEKFRGAAFYSVRRLGYRHRSSSPLTGAQETFPGTANSLVRSRASDPQQSSNPLTGAQGAQGYGTAAYFKLFIERMLLA